MLNAMPDADEEDDSLHQPHDKLFKLGFSDPDTAAGFLSAYLPEKIAEAVDWSKLTLQPGSFVDSKYRQHENDLLFAAPLAGLDVRFYFLFEHQSREDPALALRLLRYMVRIWEACLKARPREPLPVILPVVLAQNKNSWKLKPSLSALLKIPEELAEDLRPFIPDFVFRLIQLADLPFEAIRGTPSGIMVMRVMKAERTNQLLSDPVWDEAILEKIPNEVFELLLRFMMNAEIDTEGIERNIRTIRTPKLRTTAMTYAQKLHQEGRQEGRQEGQIITLRETIIDVLKVRFESVPEGLQEAINELADESKLRALHRSAIQVPTMEDFAAGL